MITPAYRIVIEKPFTLVPHPIPHGFDMVPYDEVGHLVFLTRDCVPSLCFFADHVYAGRSIDFFKPSSIAITIALGGTVSACGPSSSYAFLDKA